MFKTLKILQLINWKQERQPQTTFLTIDRLSAEKPTIKVGRIKMILSFCFPVGNTQSFFDQVNSYINQKAKSVHIQKVKNVQNDMVLYKRHSILYTSRNYMGEPKINEGSKATTQLPKFHFYPFKSAPISLSLSLSR